MNLKLRKVRRMLSAVLAGCLISSMAVSAGDIQNTAQEESTVSGGAGAEEEKLTEDGQPAGGLPDGGLSETLDSGSEDGKEEDAAEGRGPAESNQAEQPQEERDELPAAELENVPDGEGAPDAATQALLDEYEKLLDRKSVV